MSPENAQWLWPLFFPLWFVWAIPLLQAKECGWCSPSHRGHERAASLRPRDMERHVPTGAWLASGAVGALLTAATA
jgi:hypothetical protein